MEAEHDIKVILAQLEANVTQLAERLGIAMQHDEHRPEQLTKRNEVMPWL